MDALMQVAMKAGATLLKSGAETYRVEETVVRIFEAYGAQDANSFVLPTGIFSSFVYNGKNYSSVRRINGRCTDLHKIDYVNALAREVANNPLPLEELDTRLEKIINEPSYPNWAVILFAAIGACGFAFFFDGDFKDGFAALIIGAIIKVVMILLEKESISGFFATFIGGMVTVMLSVLMCNVNLGTDSDIIIISVLMLLVPGIAVTNAIRDSLAGDLVSGVARAVEAILIAVSLAVGAGAAVSLFRILGVM